MNFEELFNLAIYALINHNGGSLEQAMDDMGIKNQKTRQKIAEYLEWYDDEDDDEEDF